MGELFTTLFINPTFNILLVFMYVFSTWGIPGSLGWAIIALTALFRMASNPFYKKQAHMAVQMELLRPEIEKLQKQYKEEPKKLQEEQMKLYKDNNINPAASCVGAIIQLPVILALYQVLLKFFQTDILKISAMLNKIAYADFLKNLPIDPHFLGFNLSVAPSLYAQNGYQYLAIPLVTAFLQYLQVVKTQPKKSATKPEDKDSFQAVFQKQMKVMFPIMIGYFSYILPVGLALYWNVFSIISILQTPKKMDEALPVKGK